MEITPSVAHLLPQNFLVPDFIRSRSDKPRTPGFLAYPMPVALFANQWIRVQILHEKNADKCNPVGRDPGGVG